MTQNSELEIGEPIKNGEKEMQAQENGEVVEAIKQFMPTILTGGVK